MLFLSQLISDLSVMGKIMAPHTAPNPIRYRKNDDSILLICCFACIELVSFICNLCRSEFIFINPNSQGQCGCGESFMTTSSSTTAKGGGS